MNTNIFATPIAVLVGWFCFGGVTAQAQEKSCGPGEEYTCLAGGLITEDTVWGAEGSPYLLQGNVVVDEGVTLNVEPGVEIEVLAGKSIQIRGQLLMQGTADAPIVLDSAAAEPNRGDWSGLFFTATATAGLADENHEYVSGSIVEHAQILHAGTTHAAIRIDERPPYMNYATVSESATRGISYEGSDSFVVRSSEIFRNTDCGVYVYGSDPEMVAVLLDSRVYENDDIGVYFQHSMMPLIAGNEFVENRSHGLYLHASSSSMDSARLENNNFLRNSAHGLHIYLDSYNSLSSINNASVIENKFSGNSEHGFFLHISSGASSYSTSYGASMNNSSIDGNEYSRNGANGFYLYLDSSFSAYQFVVSTKSSSSMNGSSIDGNKYLHNGANGFYLHIRSSSHGSGNYGSEYKSLMNGSSISRNEYSYNSYNGFYLHIDSSSSRAGVTHAKVSASSSMNDCSIYENKYSHNGIHGFYLHIESYGFPSDNYLSSSSLANECSIDSNDFLSNGADGLYLYMKDDASISLADNLIIQKNRMKNNEKTGLLMDGDGTYFNTIIQNNLCEHNGAYGMDLSRLQGARVERNILANNLDALRESGLMGTNAFSYNILYRNRYSWHSFNVANDTQNNVQHNLIQAHTTPDWLIRWSSVESSREPPMSFYKNNLIANNAPYLLNVGYLAGSSELELSGNYWGVEATEKVTDSVYDFFDDSTLAIAKTEPVLATPDLDVPISVPQGATVAEVDDAFHIDWQANPELDVSGYRVWYGTEEGSVLLGTGANEGDSGIDVGTATSFALTGLEPDFPWKFSVTAYDADYNPDRGDNLWLGHESWFSTPVWEFDEDDDGYVPDEIARLSDFKGGDCDDEDPQVHPGVTEIVDDGIDQDCNGSDTVTCYTDADDDGYSANDADTSLHDDGTCSEFGWVKQTDEVDCDDSSATIYPAAPELCDGLANDCVLLGAIPEDELDGDKDGYVKCSPAQHADDSILGGGDCNDEVAAVHPDIPEHLCDGVDTNCDGQALALSEVDRDNDGYLECLDFLDLGLAPQGGSDCDDDHSGIRPGSDMDEPPADGIDQDCNGFDARWCFEDQDGDKWGGDVHVASYARYCANPGMSPAGGDCDDTNVQIHPGAEDIPGDGIDQNCSGEQPRSCYFDEDRDGFGTEDDVVIQETVLCPDNRVEQSGDLDDTDPDVYPNAPALCGDGRVNNTHRWLAVVDSENPPADCTDSFSPDGQHCEPSEESIEATPRHLYPDLDGDGFGDESAATRELCSLSSGWVFNNTDCDDADAETYPGATELCRGQDQDCDGRLSFVDSDDDGDPLPSCGGNDCDDYDPNYSSLIDEDGDGSSRCDDCDDARAGIRPGVREELCDGVDSNCDGKPLVATEVDDDEDGYLDCSPFVALEPSVGLLGGGDCDDMASYIHPTASEITDDEIDQNCDGFDSITCYKDQDEDKYGGIESRIETARYCSAGYSRQTGDWDDTDVRVYPGAPAYCEDGLVNDTRDWLAVDDPQNPPKVCLGRTFSPDGKFCEPPEEMVETARQTLYEDQDGDGFGDSLGEPWELCAEFDGWVNNQLDCDSEDPEINPGVEERCDDQDRNCDGILASRDTDGDGDLPISCGGGDCNDLDPALSSLIDRDGDKHSTCDDCNDADPSIYVGAREICSDEVDQNCDGAEEITGRDPLCWGTIGCSLGGGRLVAGGELGLVARGEVGRRGARGGLVMLLVVLGCWVRRRGMGGGVQKRDLGRRLWVAGRKSVLSVIAGVLAVMSLFVGSNAYAQEKSCGPGEEYTCLPGG